MNKEVIKQKISEINRQVVEFLSKIKNFDFKSLKKHEKYDEIRKILLEKFGHVYDYVEHNKVFSICIFSLFVWSLILTVLLFMIFVKYSTIPSENDLKKLEKDFHIIENRMDEFEDTYIYRIEDLEHKLNNLMPRIQNLEDYSHTHYN